MSGKTKQENWERLGSELGRLEKITKTDIHFCDTVLPIVEEIVKCMVGIIGDEYELEAFVDFWADKGFERVRERMEGEKK